MLNLTIFFYFMITTTILNLIIFLINCWFFLKNKSNINLNKMKIGFGYDVHRLKQNEKLVLCGIEIKHNKGLVSFSDGDVATHALIDAILGSISKFDIGTLFPNNNLKFKNISSLKLLEKTNTLLFNENYKIINIDMVIVAQKPFLKPYILQMKSKICSVLKLKLNKCSIKATTEEHLGFTGLEQGISSFCVVLIKKIK